MVIIYVRWLDINNGYKNEFELICALNNKKFKDINIIFFDLVKCLFPDIRGNGLIKAYKYGKYAKADMVLEVNDVKKGISIKSWYL